jgi:NRPS condensation-like uncharacterized protein
MGKSKYLKFYTSVLTANGEHTSMHSEKNKQTVPILKAIPKDGGFPLSLFQQRIWLIESQFKNQSNTYNIPLILHIQGKLKRDVLEKAFNEMLRRHESLRTVFREADGEPIQIILPELTIPLLMKNVQNLSAKERETELRRLAVEQANIPVVLSKGPLMRTSLLNMGPDEQVLLITIHHIIMDVWSLKILRHELAILYNAFFKGDASPLPELEVQYADFAYWQLQSITQEKLASRLNYWKQWLAAAPSQLELPTDRTRPLVETFRCSSECFRLSPKLTQKLIILSEQSGTTLFKTTLATFVILICRWSGYKDIVVGAPFGVRRHPQLEPLIGVFVNTLLVHVNIKGNPSFLELLAQVQEVNRLALANQDVPLIYLVNILRRELNLHNNYLPQVLYNFYLNQPREKLKFGDITVTSSDIIDNKSRQDLILNLWKEKNSGEISLHGMWRYKTDLFDADTIVKLSENFQILLEAIVANPEQLLEQIPIVKFKMSNEVI